jgi:hypothetical protein
MHVQSTYGAPARAVGVVRFPLWESDYSFMAERRLSLCAAHVPRLGGALFAR